MKTRPVKPVLSQIDKAIASKEKLIARLRKEIGDTLTNAREKVKDIKNRLRLAQLFLEALKRGR